MNQVPFQQVIAEICARDPRFAPEAYFFLREALDFTVKALNKPVEGPERHVTGQELTEGIRGFALQEFGPMALTVLRAWHLERTADFGEMVFNLIEAGAFGKTDKDSRSDFAGVYDFYEAFGQPYEAPAAPPPARRRRRPNAGPRG
jgi:uncharacterized repeat protein (TIGR04138 family)